MRDVCLAELAFMEQVFRELERRVPPPAEVLHLGNQMLRYNEKSPYQALLMKFARQISGLHAIDVLLLNGFLQEQGVLQRTLDDIGDQILFIAAGIIKDKWTEDQKKFLSYFWEEEFDHLDPIKSTQKRGMISSQKVRAYNARAFGLADTSTMERAGRSIHKAYSGYVHAAAPQIMDMCGGEPVRFFLSGMRGTARARDHAVDIVNYFYRGLTNANMVAKAFGVATIVDVCHARVRHFEANFGHTVFPEGMKPDSAA